MGIDFSLKKGVEYIEVKRVDIFKPIYPQAKTKVHKKTIKKPLSSFGAKVSNNFKSLPLSSKKSKSFLQGSQGYLSGVSSWYYNGFMLDSNLKTWRLENTKDLIDMVKPINTPAEVKLAM